MTNKQAARKTFFTIAGIAIGFIIFKLIWDWNEDYFVYSVVAYIALIAVAKMFEFYKKQP